MQNQKTKDQILHEVFLRHDINGKDTPNHIVWKVIKEAMDDFKDQKPIVIQGLTIGDIMEDNSECVHAWELCGYSFYKCGKENCSAWFVK